VSEKLIKHHGEEYYEEGKSLRASLDKIIRRAPAIPVADPIRVLAEAETRPPEIAYNASEA
jgi:hypothetical protein